ncbi:MAG TPA: Calx-beta domain-containing protein, partial [Verrucomicrobiae bacterium]|nr:Calx-beta domain-containing protein [Verrucomicrobiae bacterium]
MKLPKSRPVLSGALAFIVVISLTLAFWQKNPPEIRSAPEPAIAVAPRSKPAVAPPPVPSAAPVATNTAKAVATATNSIPELADFSVWAGKFAAGSNDLSVAAGEELARKRRDVMLRLIQSDPEKALAWAVPAHWRTALPASVTQYFEQRVDGRGPLNVAVATDFEKQTSKVLRDTTVAGQQYNVFVYGRRLDEVSQASIPIHGIALDGKLAVHVDPVRILEPEEVVAEEKAGALVRERICGVSGKPSNYRNQEVTIDIGGEIAFCCGVGHVKLINQSLTAAEGGTNDTTAGNEGPGVIGWTQGQKNLLYMRVNFPDDLREPITLEDAYNTMNDVNDFYVTGSYGTTWLVPTVTPLLMMPQSKNWYATAGAGSLLSDARAVAKVSGYDTANFDFDIVTFTSVPGYNFGGLAYVGGKGVWLQSPGVGVTSHELGHNYGLWHANFWDTSTTNGDSVIGPGAHEEYGNVYDTMGQASAGNNQFNAMHKNRLHWLPDLFVANVVSNGVYRIFAFDVPQRVDGQFYAAKVHKDFQRDYWIEFRQLFKSNPWLQNGVLLNWSPWALSHGGTHLLDTTPDSPNGKADAAVVIGRTFTDMPAGVHITPVAHGTIGTNLFIDVQVNMGAFPTNQPPILSIEVQPTNAAPGTPIYFQATAFDPDGDTLAYAWSFDDFSFSTNDLPWTVQAWNSPGEHVVHCEVSDMKGGVASANALVTIGSATGYRITGTVTDLNGDPVEGVRVDTGLTNGPYFGGFTDSDGNYIIVNASGQLTLNAVKYGYTLTNLTWTNPVVEVTSNADFVATPVQAVSIAVSTNAVPENSSDINYFTLTRTGDLSTNLTVSVYLSGTATENYDYSLSSPAGISPLNPGTNVFDFPPGSNQLQFAMAALNDGLAEGPETLTLTVLEDTNYVNGSLGEATITVLDNDAPPGSTVTVAAMTSSGDNSVIESDPVGGFFIFSRNGSTASDLTVHYSVSGTATPGVDYQTLLGVVIIQAGSSTASVPFRVIDDTLVEVDETATVTVSASGGYTADTTPATITIVDDDLVNVSVYPTRPAIGPSGAGQFTVVRNGDLAPNLVVSYTVSGTAVSGTDYTPLSGSVTIPGGQTSASINVTPMTHTQVEGDRSVVVTLLDNTNYSMGEAGVATIAIHDSQLPTVTVTATTPIASEPGFVTGEFTVSRGSAVSGNLT